MATANLSWSNLNGTARRSLSTESRRRPGRAPSFSSTDAQELFLRNQEAPRAPPATGSAKPRTPPRHLLGASESGGSMTIYFVRMIHGFQNAADQKPREQRLTYSDRVAWYTRHITGFAGRVLLVPSKTRSPGLPNRESSLLFALFSVAKSATACIQHSLVRYLLPKWYLSQNVSAQKYIVPSSGRAIAKKQTIQCCVRQTMNDETTHTAHPDKFDFSDSGYLYNFTLHSPHLDRSSPDITQS